MNIDNEYKENLNLETNEDLKMTNELYYDLVVYLNEMLVEIPDESNKELIRLNVGMYYDSINKLLANHALKHIVN